MTLLFPFVAIRALGREKETGTLRLLLQLPYRVPTLITAKMVAVAAAWLVALIPAASALVFWRALGGHLDAVETLNLLLGHLLYGLLIGAVALFAAAIAESAATAVESPSRTSTRPRRYSASGRAAESRAAAAYARTASRSSPDDTSSSP